MPRPSRAYPRALEDTKNFDDSVGRLQLKCKLEALAAGIDAAALAKELAFENDLASYNRCPFKVWPAAPEHQMTTPVRVRWDGNLSKEDAQRLIDFIERTLHAPVRKE